MDSSELYDRFRSDVVDVAKPYLWSREEVFGYENAAYRMFVRLTGGISDFTSVATAAPIIAGDPVGILHPSILRIMDAQRRSDGGKIEILNSTDIGRRSTSDYGQVQTLKLDLVQGPVRYGVIGMQKNVIRWMQVPAVDDVADMVIYRLPLGMITDDDQELTDVEEDHHLYLLDWMKHLAYKKQDAETFDKEKSEKAELDFRNYCFAVKAEIERYKHKNREASYGGI